MVTMLAQLPRGTGEPSIAFDMEGVKLGRHGETCFMQIRDLINKKTYLIDIQTLQSAAFLTCPENGSNLRSILCDPQVLKLIFDCRQDCDALFWLHGIDARGVIDLQYMKMLSMSHQRTHRPSYNITMEDNGALTGTEWIEWCAIKNVLQHKRFEVFKQRPLPSVYASYAVNDVKYHHRLYKNLKRLLSKRAMQLAIQWTEKETEAVKEEHWTSSQGITLPGFNEYWMRNLDMMSSTIASL